MTASRRQVLKGLASAFGAGVLQCPGAVIAASSGTQPSSSAAPPDLSPLSWPPGELTHYVTLDDSAISKPLFERRGAIIAGVSGALGLRAGFEALTRGGSSVDAVLTTALSEIVLTVGGPVSGAGEMVLLHFERATGKVHSMNAAFVSVLEENDPRSIPLVGEFSGRTVLVPGFMAGLHAAHAKFGRLPLESIFGPAFYFAEQGFEVEARLADTIRRQLDVVTHYPEGRKIFLKDDGKPYQAGDRLRQPVLARTLRNGLQEGRSYFYQGDWGRQLVAAVGAEGGKLSMRDLERYDVVWSDPVHTSFRGFEVFGAGLPSYGGINIAEALNVAELADVAGRAAASGSVDALYWTIQIAQLAELLSPPLAGVATPADLIQRYLPAWSHEPLRRPSKDSARALWKVMLTPRWQAFAQAAADAREADRAAVEGLTEGWKGRKKKPSHTAGLIAVDRAGNLSVLMHSVNGSLWGGGIFVGGVSIPDAASFQQDLLAIVGPGARVPEWDNPTIVLEAGKPYMGSVSIGAAFHEVNVQNMIGVLELGMDPKTAVDQPQIRKKWPASEPLRLPTGPKQFSPDVVDALIERQLDLEGVNDPAEASPGGVWAGMRFDSSSERWQAGIAGGLGGWAIGE